MEEKIKEAQMLFEGSYNCAQSTLSVFDNELGISKETLQHLSSGFGAGMCYQGRTCGAVAGAYMALGLISGKSFREPEMIKENTYQLIREFNKKFVEKHGSTLCKELLEIDISSAQGIEIARQKGVFETRCPNFVATAVALIHSQIK
ncbi:MAG: C-GCAxxG-C-C family protein [Salinivirgaceae bacterium]|jgi:C_GCAxxG_C_C family probable redox protein